MAHKGVYRLIGERFDLSESTVHAIVSEILHILRHNLLPTYIMWPNAARQIEISDFYLETKGITGVIGAIDATHIQIATPAEFEGDYYNRKQVHSIVLQATCDEELFFTSIDCGMPGRVHDARVFKNSDLYHNVGQSIKQFFSSTDFHLIGDTGYGCESYLITPFKDRGHMTDNQKRFNRRLASIRVVIERAFGKEI